MAKIIDAYELIEKLNKHLPEWDYTSQSGFELTEFLKGIIDECNNIYLNDDFWEGFCEGYWEGAGEPEDNLFKDIEEGE